MDVSIKCLQFKPTIEGSLANKAMKGPWQIRLSEQHAITRLSEQHAITGRKRAVDADAKEVHLSQMYEVFLQLGII